MKLLLLGATGLVGGEALKLALANDAFSEVIAPTRTSLPAHARLVNPVAPRLEEAIPLLASTRPDAVVCALGTTRAKAGSEAAFRRVDHDLPIAFAQAAHAAGTPTFAIVTFMGASADSRLFYSRTKGEVERAVRAIGFRSLTLCRPDLIGGQRQEARHAEGAALMLTRLLAPILPRRLRINPADVIARALLDAVLAAEPGCRSIDSEDMN